MCFSLLVYILNLKQVRTLLYTFSDKTTGQHIKRLQTQKHLSFTMVFASYKLGAVFNVLILVEISHARQNFGGKLCLLLSGITLSLLCTG